MKNKELFPIISLVVIIGAVTFWVFMYYDPITSKCDDDIQAVNNKINQTGFISTNDPMFLKLGTDGCADLSQSTHGMITSKIAPP